MNNIYFVAGASGSGKSAIISDLQKMFGTKITLYDFDSIGVPKDADKKWRQEATEKWIQKLITENNDVCLLGQIVLGELLACPSINKIPKINYCFLDVHDFERVKRLKKRNAYGMDQNMLNWSSWLRVHHQDPSWQQHVIKNDAWSKLDFSNWDDLIAWPEKIEIKIIDTTNLSVEQVAQKVAKWIENISLRL